MTNELVLTFEGLHFCVKFGENRQRNATVRVTAHGQTDRQTDAKRFYYSAAALHAMQSTLIPRAIPSVCPSVRHTLVPYPDK